MTERIRVDSWLADEEPIEIEVGRRVFRCRPVSFNEALAVYELLGTMGAEYISILQNGQGERDLVTHRQTDQMLEALLSQIRFAGVIPDRIQRRRLVRLLSRKPMTVRVQMITEISDHFIACLRQSLERLANALPRARSRPPTSSDGQSPSSSTTGRGSSRMAGSAGADSGGSSPRSPRSTQ
jgi:hypothetical protein